MESHISTYEPGRGLSTLRPLLLIAGTFLMILPISSSCSVIRSWQHHKLFNGYITFKDVEWDCTRSLFTPISRMIYNFNRFLYWTVEYMFKSTFHTILELQVIWLGGGGRVSFHFHLKFRHPHIVK